MLNVKIDRTDIGVIVGRFQTHELSPGHIDLINSVRANHDRVIIFLGLAPLRNTLKNPLDFRCRKAMIAEVFPDIEVYYIDDIPNDDAAWSRNLDQQILKWKNPSQSVTLYGGRDSFIKHYLGKLPTVELEAKDIISSTELRRRVCNNYPPTKDYRAGIVASTALRFPATIPTVDIAVLDRPGKRALFIKKVGEPKYRFAGGFAVRSATYEDDAKREVSEELKVEISDPLYIGSALSEDPRYQGERDCIKTLLFVSDYIFGSPNVSNEEDLTENIESYHWVAFDKLSEDDIMPTHKVLLRLLMKFLKIVPAPIVEAE